MILPYGCVPDKTGGEEHLVRWLKDALQMGGETLGEGELLGDSVEGDPPGHHAFGASDLEEAVEAAGDGGIEGGVARGGKGGGMTSRDVRAKNWGKGDSRVARLGGGKRCEERELIPVGDAAAIDRDRGEDGEGGVDRPS